MGWPRIENRQDYLDSNTAGLLPPHDHIVLPEGQLHGLRVGPDQSEAHVSAKMRRLL